MAAIANCNNRSEEHTSELQSHSELVCRLLLEKKKNNNLFRRLNEEYRVDRIEQKARKAVGPSFFFFNDTATTEIYTLSLHDALPISPDDLTRVMPIAFIVAVVVMV